VAVRYGHGKPGSASLYGGSGGFAPSGVQGLGPGQRVWGAKPSEAGAYFTGNVRV